MAVFNGPTSLDNSSIATYEQQFKEKYGRVIRFSGDDLVFKCPECGKNALSCSRSKGIFQCFHCGHGKGIRLTGRSDIIIDNKPIDTEALALVSQTLINKSRLKLVDREYLKDRGIRFPERFKIVSTPLDSVKTLLAEGLDREILLGSGLFAETENGDVISRTLLDPGRILIPYWFGEEILAVKSRMGPLSDEDVPRYLAPYGFKVATYLWHKGTPTEDIIVTEGELQSVVASEFGFYCTSFAGLQAWNKVENSLLALVQSSNVKRVFVIPDADNNWQENRSHLNLALKAYESLANKCCVVFLSSTEKVQLDDYLISNGAKELLDLLEDNWSIRYELRENYRGMLGRMVLGSSKESNKQF